VCSSDLDNIILGGYGDDTVSVGAGTSVVLGDNGIIRRDAGETVTQVATTDTTAATGGVDGITTTGGTNVVLGGVGGDRITAAGVANIVLGDNGVVNMNNAGPNDIFTTNLALGGDDTILAGANNIILGGYGDDSITLEAGTAVVLGDNGIVRRDATETVTQVATTDTTAATGGVDTITSAGGTNVILGGVGGDTIEAPGGTNIILGDNGTVNLNNLVANDIFTTDPALGGNDRITGGTGDNIILGGAGSDSLAGTAASERLVGGAGDDTLAGGGGAPIPAEQEGGLQE
jgi:Ca2+-binding RTX toxin-like protein